MIDDELARHLPDLTLEVGARAATVTWYENAGRDRWFGYTSRRIQMPTRPVDAKRLADLGLTAGVFYAAARRVDAGEKIRAVCADLKLTYGQQAFLAEQLDHQEEPQMPKQQKLFGIDPKQIKDRRIRVIGSIDVPFDQDLAIGDSGKITIGYTVKKGRVELHDDESITQTMMVKVDEVAIDGQLVLGGDEPEPAGDPDEA